MDHAQWHFREFKPGDNVSDPDFARALFTGDDSIAARSLVREAIQNSLDARRLNIERVEVRFAIRDGAQAARLADVGVFFQGLWEHIASKDSGVEVPPDRHAAVNYLVVEDFGTRGLTGDPDVWDPFDAQKNSFFMFFRALGKSGKQGEDRGRWGVGKFVFPMTSRGHSLLALTIPESGRDAMVMGRSVLKTHRTSSKSYHPDGHWGTRKDTGLVVPATDERTVNELTRLFSLKRRNEPGLSVIVPWLQEGIAGDALEVAVAGEYFLPILRGELSVEIDENGIRRTVDSDRLVEIAETIEPPLVRSRIALALEAATWPQSELIKVSGSTTVSELEWQDGQLTDEQRSAANSALESGEVVGFRVPTRVRPKDGSQLPSYFDVFIRHVPGLGRVRPLIVREGITVSGDKTSYLQDHVALVVVDDPALATFVGDAETPAHNELQYDLVKPKYTLAGKLIHLLRNAPSAIIRELEGGDRTADHTLLAAFFPRREPAPLPRKPQPKPSSRGNEIDEVPDVPTRPARFRIGQSEAGFTVAGTGEMKVGAWITIDCAYEVRRGNPLRKYRDLDFALERDLDLKDGGVTVHAASGNRIVAEVEDPKFHIAVEGFDPNRNLFIRVNVDEPGADQ